MVQVVYILGSGRCGSTLLNSLLNAHKDMVGLSEILTISRFQKEKWERLFRKQPLWKEINDYYQSKYQQSLAETHFYKALFNKELITANSTWVEKQAQPYWNLFTATSEKLQVPIVVDASKTPSQLYLLKKGLNPSSNNQLKVIHLLRDGRAVVNSYRREDGNFNLGMQRWLKSTLGASLQKLQFSSEDWLKIRYEDLALNTQPTLEKICQFIGVEYQPQMRHFLQEPVRIGISGNFFQYRQEKGENIVLDDRWKTELSPTNILQFNLMAGWLNKLYGY